MGYKVATIYGIGWISLLQVGTRIISLAKIIIVAKIVSPYEFGIFALVTTILSLAEVFTDASLQTFLIQKKHDLEKVISSVWRVILFRGVILFCAVLLFSFPASLFFHAAPLFHLLLVAAFIPLVKAFENPYVVSFQKRLRFKLEFFYRLAGVTVDFVASVILVLLLHSVLGLVLGLLVAVTFGVGVSWIVIKDRPSWKFKKKYLREISQFMRSIIPMNILNFAVNQYDVLFVGRFSGPSMVGIYQLGQKFSSVPLIELSDIFGKVTFPIYTKFAEDRVRLLNAYMRIVLSVLIIGFIGVVFLFTASSYLIRFLGPSWSGISSFFPVLLAYGFLMSLWGTTGSLFLSLSAQVILARIAFIRFLLTIPIVGAATYLYGITGTAWGLLLSILMVIPITVYYFLRFFHRKNKG